MTKCDFCVNRDKCYSFDWMRDECTRNIIHFEPSVDRIKKYASENGLSVYEAIGIVNLYMN